MADSNIPVCALSTRGKSHLYINTGPQQQHRLLSPSFVLQAFHSVLFFVNDWQGRDNNPLPKCKIRAVASQPWLEKQTSYIVVNIWIASVGCQFISSCNTDPVFPQSHMQKFF